MFTYGHIGLITRTEAEPRPGQGAQEENKNDCSNCGLHLGTTPVP